MSLNFIEKWYSELPDYERGMPIMKLGNVSYTPQQILHEVRRGSSIGNELQKKVEGARLAHSFEEDEALAEERLTKLLKEKPIRIAMLILPEYGKEEFSSKELIEHIKKKDDIGKAMVESELEQVEAMLKLGK